jgi:hypothetical protein
MNKLIVGGNTANERAFVEMAYLVLSAVIGYYGAVVTNSSPLYMLVGMAVARVVLGYLANKLNNL